MRTLEELETLAKSLEDKTPKEAFDTLFGHQFRLDFCLGAVTHFTDGTDAIEVLIRGNAVVATYWFSHRASN